MPFGLGKKQKNEEYTNKHDYGERPPSELGRECLGVVLKLKGDQGGQTPVEEGGDAGGQAPHSQGEELGHHEPGDGAPGEGEEDDEQDGAEDGQPADVVVAYGSMIDVDGGVVTTTD